MNDPLAQASPPPLFAESASPAPRPGATSNVDRAEQARQGFAAALDTIDWAIATHLEMIKLDWPETQSIIQEAENLSVKLRYLVMRAAALGRELKTEGGAL